MDEESTAEKPLFNRTVTLKSTYEEKAEKAEKAEKGEKKQVEKKE